MSRYTLLRLSQARSRVIISIRGHITIPDSTLPLQGCMYPGAVRNGSWRRWRRSAPFVGAVRLLAPFGAVRWRRSATNGSRNSPEGIQCKKCWCSHWPLRKSAHGMNGSWSRSSERLQPKVGAVQLQTNGSWSRSVANGSILLHAIGQVPAL